MYIPSIIYIRALVFVSNPRTDCCLVSLQMNIFVSEIYTGGSMKMERDVLLKLAITHSTVRNKYILVGPRVLTEQYVRGQCNEHIQVLWLVSVICLVKYDGVLTTL